MTCGGKVGEEGRVGEDGWVRRGGVKEEGRDVHFHHHMCDKKCATMDHEGPSMSVIIYIDHQLTSPLMFT